MENNTDANEFWDDPDLELLWWAYDDGTYGSICFDKDDQCCSEYKYHQYREALDLEIERYKERLMQNRRLEFGAGITKAFDYLRTISFHGLEKEYAYDCFQELTTMLTGYEKDGSKTEILSLLSLILSGYMARIYMERRKHPSTYFSRAPLVVIRKNPRDLCGGFEHLERIARSLIVDTSRDLDFLMVNPLVLPSCNRENSIDKCAYAKVREAKVSESFPTSYTDTAVLIHCGFFKEKAIEEFFERNKWCTILLFHPKKPDWEYLLAEVDMGKMELPVWNWKPKRVHYLVDNFVSWLCIQKKRADKLALNSKDEKIRGSAKEARNRIRAWMQAGESAVHRYNLASISTGQRVKQGSEWDLACLQIMSIAAFVEFLHEVKVLGRQDCESLFDEWINALLPGSQNQEILERSQKQIQQSNEIKEERVLHEFEHMIKKTLEYGDGEKVYFIPKGEAYPSGPKLDLLKDPWAFLCTMKINKRDVPVIKIRYDELERLAEMWNLQQYGEISREQRKQILAKKQKENPALSYVHQMDNFRLKLGEDTKSKPGLTLLVEKMDFLDDKIREGFIARVSRTE